MIKAIKENKFLFAILLIAGFLLFLNLGASYLTIDEANTGYLAKNILKFGYPRAYDGRNILPTFFEGSINKDYAWIEQPWLQYYITALSLKLFGINSVAARLPFSIFGFLSIIVVYKLAEELSNNKTVAKLSILLMTLSVPFLLYSRNCRYYSLVFFFGPMTFLSFLYWIKEKRKKYLVLYVISSVLLFYSYYPMWFCAAFSAFVYMFFVHKKDIRPFIAANIISVLCFVPWLIVGSVGGPAGSNISLKFMLTEGFFLYVWKLHTYIFPFFPLLLIYFILKKQKQKGKIKQKDYGIQWNRKYVLFSGLIIYFIIISFIPMIVSQYLVGLMPFIYIISSLLLLKICEYNKYVFIALLLLQSFTNFLHISPFVLVKSQNVNPDKVASFLKNPQSVVLYGATPSLEYYLNEYLEGRFYFFDFLYEISHDYDTRMEGIIKCLKEKGDPSDTVLTWWGEAHVLLFHTDMKILYHPFPMSQNKEQIELMTNYEGNIDWVSLDGIFKQKELVSSELDPAYGNIDTTDYFNIDLEKDFDKILIPYPKMYFDPPPNIEFHNFRTDTKAPYFYIYKRK